MLPRNHTSRRQYFPKQTVQWVLAEIGLFMICAYLMISDFGDPKGLSFRMSPYSQEVADTIIVAENKCLTIRIDAYEAVFLEDQLVSPGMCIVRLVVYCQVIDSRNLRT